GAPSISQETAFRFTDGSGRDAAAAGCLATGLRALNAVPAVNHVTPVSMENPIGTPSLSTGETLLSEWFPSLESEVDPVA
ncbi:hypothetical protein PXH80_33910, partial [Mycolicibacterium smegmatis]|nr:hypothetical protein [Mycolicibacterium smegmatis]